MAYKQQPKSPVLKALVGDQHKLPKVLKDAIAAAPESPAKQTVVMGSKDTKDTRKQLNKDLAAASTNEEKASIQRKLRQAEKQQYNYDVTQSRNNRLEKSAEVLDATGNANDAVKAQELRSRKRGKKEPATTYSRVMTDATVKRRPKISEMNSPTKKYKK